MNQPGSERPPDDPGTFWDFLRAWWPGFSRRVFGPPPPLSESDFVPPEAEPICPTCIVPHHALLSRCPNCGEFVGPYNTILYLDWIYIWGRGMSDLVWRRELTPLLRAGVVVMALLYFAESALVCRAVVQELRDLAVSPAPDLLTGLTYGGGTLQMLITGGIPFVAFVMLVRALLRPRPAPDTEQPET